MPYGQVHYPFEQQQEFHYTFPADFVVEYVAQTRGWFYTLVVLATALFDQPPFKNVVCHGVILAHDGRKMSKRLKNYPDPVVLVNEHGSDALRTALLSSPVISGNDIRFNPDAVRDAVRRYCIPLWNSLHYFTSYARIDAFEPTGNLAGTNRLDRYLLHETDTLRNAIETSMEQYDFATAYRSIEEYIVMLSTWYIRLSRPRLWGEGLTGDKRAAYESLHEALTTLSRLIAPFLPFLAESIHTALGADESVHVQEWPAPKPHWRDDAIAEEMRLLRTVVRLGRSIRERHEAKHRHPLRHLALAGVPESVIELNRELLMTELNVKGVSTLSSPEEYVERRIALNPERLGRRLRADFARLKSLVASGRYVIQPDGWLHADDISVMPDEFEVRFVAREGNVGIAAEGNLVLVLDLVAYPELALEGQARDLNRKLQDLRKEARLKYSDRVDISVVGPSPIPAVLDQFETWLAEQLLATRIERTPLNSPLASADVHISGVPVQLSLRRSGAQAC
jgi:isoleucyl-tRNA synthetase